MAIFKSRKQAWVRLDVPRPTEFLLPDIVAMRDRKTKQAMDDLQAKTMRVMDEFKGDYISRSAELVGVLAPRACEKVEVGSPDDDTKSAWIAAGMTGLALGGTAQAFGHVDLNRPAIDDVANGLVCWMAADADDPMSAYLFRAGAFVGFKNGEGVGQLVEALN